MSIATIENGEPVSVIGSQQNVAADYDVSKKYTPNDYDVVKGMTLCNRVIGGLVLELEHPEWLNLSYEELLDKILSTKEDLEKQLQKQLDEMPEVTIQKKTNSPDYEAIYNKIIIAFNDASDDELSDLMDKVANGEEIRDKKGNIIIGKGE